MLANLKRKELMTWIELGIREGLQSSVSGNTMFAKAKLTVIDRETLQLETRDWGIIGPKHRWKITITQED